MSKLQMLPREAKGAVRLALLLTAALLATGCALPTPPRPPTPYYEEILRAEPFTQLVIEVDHAPGRAPSLSAQEHLLQTLRNVTSKASVTMRLEASLPDEARTWTSQDLVDLEERTRTTQHTAPVAVLHVLYPAGQYEEPGVAGLTVSGNVIGPVTVFRDTLDDIDLGLPIGPLPTPAAARDQMERVTLLHEAGHAIGLVDNGLPMVEDHEDPEHDGHSANPQSIMYWRFEQADGLREGLLDDGTLPETFDADDRADVRAAGGR